MSLLQQLMALSDKINEVRTRNCRAGSWAEPVNGQSRNRQIVNNLIPGEEGAGPAAAQSIADESE